MNKTCPVQQYEGHEDRRAKMTDTSVFNNETNGERGLEKVDLQNNTMHHTSPGVHHLDMFR